MLLSNEKDRKLWRAMIVHILKWHGMLKKEKNNGEKYLNLEREPKYLPTKVLTLVLIIVGVLVKVLKILAKMLEYVKIWGESDPFLQQQSARILRRVLENWREFLLLNLYFEPPVTTFVKAIWFLGVQKLVSSCLILTEIEFRGT